MPNNSTYIALLRGINVGGHHKVPMAELREAMEQQGFTKIITLLNTGNIIFDASVNETDQLEIEIADVLQSTFGFPIPVLIRKKAMLLDLVQSEPFKEIAMTKDIRLYISFLKKKPEMEIETPWVSVDGSFRILEVRDRAIISVLDISITKTPQGMEALERLFGKDTTTRNWNTILRIAGKLD